MKSKNNDKVRQAIFRFTKYLVVTIVLAVCVFSGFMKTSSVEVYKILEKTSEYDQIQARQVDLTERMDTLYFYASLLNSDPKINHILMQSTLSSRKIQFSNELSVMSEKDCSLYKKMSGQINAFLDIKDSIKIITSEEEQVKMELLRCISDNKKITRRISTGGLTFEN